MSTIVIIDRMHPSIIPSLESLGYKVDYRPDITRPELKRIIGNYQGLIVRSKTTIDQELLDSAQGLQFVGRAGAGVDNLAEDIIRDRGIHIVNAPEGNRNSLGEHLTGMLLSLLHRINEAGNSIRAGQWDREAFRGSELGMKNVGIIGCGNMGNAFSKCLSGFGCKVYGYDKYKPDEKSTTYERVTLEQLFTACDIVSLHVPLTPETRGFYNYSFFQQFKRPIILLNSARGEILPLTDLVRLIKERKVVGAALDVYEKEPFLQIADNQLDIYNFLISSPLVVLTPHVAGWSIESYERINQVLVDKIKVLKAESLID